MKYRSKAERGRRVGALAAVLAVVFSSFAHVPRSSAASAETSQFSVRTFGGANSDDGVASAIDSEANIFIAGTFSGSTDFDQRAGAFFLTSAGSTDTFIVKLDPYGALLWATAVGGVGRDEVAAITVDQGGNVYVAGWFEGTADFDPGPGVTSLTATGSKDAFILKLSASGAFLWAKQLRGSAKTSYTATYPSGIAVNAAGDVYMAGRFLGEVDFDPAAGTAWLGGSSVGSAFITKLSSSGTLLWAKQGSARTSAHGVAVDAAGSVLTTGNFQPDADFDPGPGTYILYASAGAFYYPNAYVWKLDTDGNFVWAKHLAGVDVDPYAIAVDATGNVYSTGWFSQTADFEPGTGVSNLSSVNATDDAYVLKLNAAGNFVWAKRFGGAGQEFPAALTIDSAGHVYAAGNFSGTSNFDPGVGVANHVAVPAGTTDAFLVKLDSSGNFMWAGSFGGPGNDVATSVLVTQGLSAYLTGSFAESADFDPGTGTANVTSSGSTDTFSLRLEPELTRGPLPTLPPSTTTSLPPATTTPPTVWNTQPPVAPPSSTAPFAVKRASRTPLTKVISVKAPGASSWRASGGCSIAKGFLVAPKRATTCKVVLTRTVHGKKSSWARTVKVS
jgi:hypothetical protein